MKETEIQNNQPLTVGIFNQAMMQISERFNAVDRRFDNLEQKIMEGFDALDRKIDLVENNLSTQIDELTFVKVDRLERKAI